VSEIPHNQEAEIWVIGGALMHPEEMPQVIGLMDLEDFYTPLNNHIYKILTQLHKEKTPLDAQIVIEELVSQGVQREVAQERMKYIDETVMTSTRFHYYARKLKKMTGLRKILSASYDIYEKAGNSNADLDDLKSEAMASIREATDLAGNPRDGVDIRETIVDTLDAVLEKRPLERAVGTGIVSLDAQCGGMFPELIILAGRTRMGKTGFACNLATNAGLIGRKVSFFSLEDSSEVITGRILARLSGVDSKQIRLRKTTFEEDHQIRAAGEKIKELNITIYENRSLTAEQVCNMMRGLEDTDLFIIDHLGQVADKSKHGLFEDTTRACRAFARVASEIHKPVILLSQLNRESEKDRIKGSVREPRLTDLRQSGELEQLARAVWLIHRPWEYDHDGENPHLLKLIIAKNSHGPGGKTDLYCDMATMYIGDEPGAEY